jgi:hypothetical protein
VVEAAGATKKRQVALWTVTVSPMMLMMSVPPLSEPTPLTHEVGPWRSGRAQIGRRMHGRLFSPSKLLGLASCPDLIIGTVTRRS